MLYANDGSINVTVVSGFQYVGRYASDGSLNVKLSDGASFVGQYHSSGAMNVTVISSTPTTPTPWYNADGSTNICVSPNKFGDIMRVTVVSGSFALTSPSGLVSNFEINTLKGYSLLNGVFNTATSPITFTRASSGYAASRSGNWSLFGTNIPRITDRGMLIETSRINSVRNNSMQGAEVGGLFPTNWLMQNNDGIVGTVAGLGTEKGIDYIDVNFAGTSSVGGLAVILSTDSNTAASMLYGQTWASSFFCKLVSGTLNIPTPTYNILSYPADGVTVQDNVFVSHNLTSEFTRVKLISTRSVATSIYIQQRLFRFVTPTAGTVVNFTVRFGWPQLELSNTESMLQTATVSAGGTGYTDGDVLTISGGTGTAATVTVLTSTAGVINTVSVTNQGSYTVFPPSPAAVTGGTGTSATFNLLPVILTNITPVASSPIRSTGSATSRGADNARVTGTGITDWNTDPTTMSLLLQFSTEDDYNGSIIAGFINDAAPNLNDSIYFINFGPTFGSNWVVRSASATTSFTNASVFFNLTTSSNRTVARIKVNDFARATNVDNLVTDVVGGMPTLTMDRLALGHSPLSFAANRFFGYLERIVGWNTALTDSDISTLAPLR